MENLMTCKCGVVLDKSVCQECPVCGELTFEERHTWTSEEKKQRK